MTGAELIAQERQRQIDDEGWTPEHDDEHTKAEMVRAACGYAVAGSRENAVEWYVNGSGEMCPPFDWPWHADWWKPSDDRIRNLVKAGALIAAEIERLQRRNLHDALRKAAYGHDCFGPTR